tara:strand:- start:378 stop:779 length:402 start_codon:yes stop_codon:yes gene_type:complete
MADKIFPLVSQNVTADLNLTIESTEATKTQNFEVDSRKVIIKAQGNATATGAAPAYTVNLTGPTGLVFFVDINNLNINSADVAATSIVFKKGKNTLTLDAADETASVMLTDEGFQEATDLLLIGASANDPTFA